MPMGSLSTAGPGMADPGELLVIGYGNPGRGDDGLGPEFARRLAALAEPGVRVEIDYQLTVDHALMVAGVDRVLFVDAAMGLAEPCRLRRLSPDPLAALDSHSLSAEAVLALAEILYDRRPDGFQLAIQGEQFGEVSEVLSPAAERNLDLGQSMFRAWLANHPLPVHPDGAGSTSTHDLDAESIRISANRVEPS